MEREPEAFKPPEHYSVPNPSHGVKVKVQIVERIEDTCGHLAREKEVA